MVISVKKMIIRFIQIFQKMFIKMIKWEDPILLNEEYALNKLPLILKSENVKSIFIITDKNIGKLGLIDEFLNELDKLEINYDLYADTLNNPTIKSIEHGLECFRKKDYDLVVAIGGGSVIDSAKLILARRANPSKNLKKLKGYLKIKNPISRLIVVPTTAGTGAEATIVAVVSDDKTHEKYAITSPKLIPSMVVLDSSLTIKLPPHLTAYTGMDAFVHAIECYLGKANTKKTKELSLKAIKTIWKHLRVVVEDGNDIQARRKMLEASFNAGCAFTRGFVGYVHALSHQLSGFYNIQHGLANAVILPKVLRKYGKSINKDMYTLYKTLGYKKCLSIDEARVFLIEKIEELNRVIGITDKLTEIKAEDLEIMVKRCRKEAHPMYPVPKILTKNELISIYKEMI